MSSKITVADAALKYGVTQKTIRRWVVKWEITRFPDGMYDLYQLDALVDNYGRPAYSEVDWKQAACKDLPTDFFYKVEDRYAIKTIGTDVFRFTCTPCPIWRQCLNYATHHENHGVWGGMTSDERQAILDYKNSDLRDKVFKDFQKYGISKKMILQAIGK
jgi:WhiB family redox-sensing transcriptional regulator